MLPYQDFTDLTAILYPLQDKYSFRDLLVVAYTIYDANNLIEAELNKEVYNLLFNKDDRTN